jgi:PBP1b-binding outer membrane lipoprotein LpoB
MKRTLTLLLAIFFLFGCKQVNELTPDEKVEIANEVKQISLNYWELNRDLTRENYEKVQSFYDRNFESLWQTEPVMAVLNLNSVKSFDEFLKKFDEIFEDRASTDFTIHNQHLSVLSRDVVVEVIEMDYTIHNRDGEVYGPFDSVFTIIWHKIGGEWKYFHINQAYRTKKVAQ